MEIKVLDSIDYDVVGKLLHDSYIQQWGKAGSPEWSNKYIEYLDKAYIKPKKGPYVGAFEGNKLVGIGFGFIHDWIVSEIGKITVMCICNCGILPDYQRKGIATSIVKKLEEEGKKKGIKLIYRLCNEDLNDYLVLERVRYVKKMNNVYQCARIMGSEMINKTAELKGYGKAMKLLLKMVAGFPKEKSKIQDGVIRAGSEMDISECIKISNAYSESAAITRIWTDDEFKSIIINRNILNGTPFSVFFYVWDVDGKIKTFAIGRYEKIVYSRGYGIPAIIVHSGFASDLAKNDKTSFVVSLLYKIKEKASENTFATNLAVAHHEEKAFDKAGFNNDRSTRPLYVKALSEELNEWLRTDWNYKSYLIPYQR